MKILTCTIQISDELYAIIMQEWKTVNPQTKIELHLEYNLEQQGVPTTITIDDIEEG
jgi:hypothetical protein